MGISALRTPSAFLSAKASMLFSAALVILCIAPVRAQLFGTMPGSVASPNEVPDAVSDQAIEFVQLIARYLLLEDNWHLKRLAFPCEEELQNIKKHLPYCVEVVSERANTTSGVLVEFQECATSCAAVFASAAALSSDEMTLSGETCRFTSYIPAQISALAQSLDAYCTSALPHVIDIAAAPNAESMKAESAEYLDLYLPTWTVRLLMLPIGAIIDGYWRAAELL